MTAKPTAHELAQELNSAFGEGSVKLGSDPSLAVRYWPSGILPFDVITGGGVAAGRSIEIFGDYSTLKTYIGLCTIAVVQESGGTASLVDTEHAFDPGWAADLGVDVDKLIVQHPEDGESAIQASELLIRSNVDLIVWDSVASTQPRAYKEAQPGTSADQAPARLAAMMSSGLRRLNSANTNTALLFINQTRVNVGMTFGPKEANPGGKALGFYASQRVRLSKAGKITVPSKAWEGEKMIDVKKTVGTKIKMTLEKSKLNRPHQEEWFIFDHVENCVDEVGYLMAKGLEAGLIIQNGAMYTVPDYDDTYKVRGREKFAAAFAEDEDMQAWVLTTVLGE